MNKPTQTNQANKFAAILQARKESTSEDQELASVPTVTAGAEDAVVPTQPVRGRPAVSHKRTPSVLPHVPSSTSVLTLSPTMEETRRRAGRPPGRGKKSDPTFRPMTAYVPRDLHANATIALRISNESKIDIEKEDFSELLTRLLAEWYENQNFYKPREG